MKLTDYERIFYAKYNENVGGLFTDSTGKAIAAVVEAAKRDAVPNDERIKEMEKSQAFLDWMGLAYPERLQEFWECFAREACLR